MRAIFILLFVSCAVVGILFLLKNPHWITDSEHISALGIGLVLGFALGKLL